MVGFCATGSTGSPADTYDFVALAPLLAERYTVVAYDWRGFSCSRIDGASEEVPMEARRGLGVGGEMFEGVGVATEVHER